MELLLTTHSSMYASIATEITLLVRTNREIARQGWFQHLNRKLITTLSTPVELFDTLGGKEANLKFILEKYLSTDKISVLIDWYYGLTEYCVDEILLSEEVLYTTALVA